MGKKIDRPAAKQEINYRYQTRAIQAGGIIGAPQAQSFTINAGPSIADPAAMGLAMNYTPSTTTASTSYNVAQVLRQQQ